MYLGISLQIVSYDVSALVFICTAWIIHFRLEVASPFQNCFFPTLLVYLPHSRHLICVSRSVLMSPLFCIPKVNWLSWRLRSSLSSDRLGIYPWLPDPGQPLASPCGSFRTLMGASVSMSPAWHRCPCVNKHLGKGRYFRGWIIYSARLETLSWVKDLVACMFVSALDSKTWPGLICRRVCRACVRNSGVWKRRKRKKEEDVRVSFCS